MDASEARVLEIGDLKYIKEAFPDRTTLLWTDRKPPAYWLERHTPVPFARDDYLDCTPANFMRCMSDARAGRYDLVVAYLPLYSPWHPRYGVRSQNERLPWLRRLTNCRNAGESWFPRFRQRCRPTRAPKRTVLTVRCSGQLARERDFFGTFAPARRACERPIATACLRLVTGLRSTEPRAHH